MEPRPPDPRDPPSTAQRVIGPPQGGSRRTAHAQGKHHCLCLESASKTPPNGSPPSVPLQRHDATDEVTGVDGVWVRKPGGISHGPQAFADSCDYPVDDGISVVVSPGEPKQHDIANLDLVDRYDLDAERVSGSECSAHACAAEQPPAPAGSGGRGSFGHMASIAEPSTVACRRSLRLRAIGIPFARPARRSVVTGTHGPV